MHSQKKHRNDRFQHFRQLKHYKNYKKYLYITALLKSLIKKVAKAKNCTFAKIRNSG
jgi:hypothetical protein